MIITFLCTKKVEQINGFFWRKVYTNDLQKLEEDEKKSSCWAVAKCGIFKDSSFLSAVACFSISKSDLKVVTELKNRLVQRTFLLE